MNVTFIAFLHDRINPFVLWMLFSASLPKNNNFYFQNTWIHFGEAHCFRDKLLKIKHYFDLKKTSSRLSSSNAPFQAFFFIFFLWKSAWLLLYKNFILVNSCRELFIVAKHFTFYCYFLSKYKVNYFEYLLNNFECFTCEMLFEPHFTGFFILFLLLTYCQFLSR